MGWRYHAGLGLIGAFVLIWVSSAEITQRIFVEYKRPFALTYLGVSLLVIYFPISVFKKWICTLLKTLFRNFHEDHTLVSISSGLDVPFRIEGILQRPESVLESSFITDKEIREREEGMPLVKKEKEEDEPPLLAHSYESSSWKIAKCGLYLTPIWFAQEYFSNMALANTSVASTTVLSSMSGLFTLFFGALLGQESVNMTKISAVLISMAGVAMTTVGKTWAADEKISMTQKHSIIGDIFALLSAICYGLFTVLLKNSAGSGDKVDMQKLFGCIGLYSLLGFWWLGMDFFLENFAQTDSTALSMVWTAPLVATLGMSLTIPVAMIADMVIHGRNFSALYTLGCIQVSLLFSTTSIV
ncbi:hypothetical protein CR513_22246, partial [Mucuna pruriens]